MVLKFLRKIVGTKNDRELKRMSRIVARVNALEPQFEAMDDAALRALTPRFRERVAAGETLDQLLPEAFAAVREASRRTLGMRHFDMQLVGGLTLHEGRIAEMRTGEGKTLVATLPVYLNALAGTGVHVVTVNDYLARRDAHWMEPVYRFLGMTVGVILPNQDLESKRHGYAADITYGTNNEFGFDYLRDNMVFSLEDKMQRALNFAIVDEVDSILIDEARTPLIISGAAEDSSRLYKRINALVPRLRRGELPPDADKDFVPEGHFTVDEKTRQVELTEEGHRLIEEMLISEELLPEGESLYHAMNLGLLHHVNTALRAQYLFQRDVEYIVQNGQVVLIDEHTGRTMQGRRLSEGLHQAIEAKEGVHIQSESQTLASTTFQNYFRLYDKLAGMTGTADTEAFEFRQIYGLDVVVIPTNKPCIRKDLNDLVYLSKEEKFEAVVSDIQECMEKGAPVLVGTASIETSEELSAFLGRKKIAHQVLNAKYHEREAEIISQAGRPATVTIATNMAGRGTDIVLGGNLEVELAALKDASAEQLAALRAEWQERHRKVLEAGGLHIIGTERHESRRIDNQLRGRAGRQGDPGMSRFYLSLEDNLMRIFASERVKGFMQRLGMQRGEAIEHRMVSNAIEKAQRKVEGRNFDIRKQLLEFDDVANDQRRVVYQQRNELLGSTDVSDTIARIRADVVNGVIDQFIAPQSLEEQWQIAGLEEHLLAEYGLALPVARWLEEESGLEEQSLRTRIVDAVGSSYAEKVAPLGAEIYKLERHIMLQVLDTLWKDHLAAMDALRQGIHLRAYAARNPKQEYKREAFKLFEELLDNIKYEVVRFLSKVQVRTEQEVEDMERQQREAQERQSQNARYMHAAAPELAADPQPEEAAPPEPEPVAPFVRETRKVGRNEACPCGSGKKYKQCHGQIS
ncbi:MAG: preprotein translocase subunit SecA [Pseudomonadales bacterium]|jgi:preprotein translocase subunit SecA|nr:preprotein translocase subunit SecA [Gammaproteobacteria bacterium]MBK6584687.1 preprotein translocase subunit SecA [Gammaproteobacteria bacterium]MBK9666683.1 preprotein translocase subunit SecA [Gammaproteobacteria bacterium]MBP6051678.1 preprotein translocase subunit SecA [Pseudomonadales bacterium]MBP6226600.1 preprotein translocase subunit SecA [Pseudomonadales bacterium]